MKKRISLNGFRQKISRSGGKQNLGKIIRNRCHNIMSQLPKTKGLAKNVTSSVKSWELEFVDDSMIQILVECTNIFIEKCAPIFSRESDARETDLMEIRALLVFFFFLYMLG